VGVISESPNDSGAGTLAIMGASVTIADLPSDLQTLWNDVVALNSTSVQLSGAHGAFGGNQIGQVVGEILDRTPTWREAVQAAISAYVAMSTADGTIGDQQSAIY
jgi:hypothetical protein